MQNENFARHTEPRHTELNPLDQCVLGWLPDNRNPDFYRGFLIALQITRTIESLVLPEYRLLAHRLMVQRCEQKLAENEQKLAEKPHN